MIVTITKIMKRVSQTSYGGYYYHVFFKGEDCKSYFTYVFPKMRNWKNWEKALKVGIVLDGLQIKKGNLIDADSIIKIIEND